MASAEVMAMPVDTPGAPAAAAGKQRQGAAAEDAGAAQDVYVKLKSLQKHMEFLDIQVGREGVVREKLWVGLGWCNVQLPFLSDVYPADGRHLSISVFFSSVVVKGTRFRSSSSMPMPTRRKEPALDALLLVFPRKEAENASLTYTRYAAMLKVKRSAVCCSRIDSSRLEA